ncbi:MAG: glycosyltransferase family 4 protein [Planctomycetales bacterium]|nr:glycosyltransferase family 4 protein [Planctomycetales bacterium]
MSPLRVVLVTRCFWPVVGGAEMLIANLAAAMRTLGACPQIVTAQWRREWPTALTFGEIPVHRIPQSRRRGWGTLQYMRGLGRWLRDHRGAYDAICVSSLRHSAYVVARRARREAIPVLLRAESSGEQGDCRWQETARLGRRIRSHCQRAMVLATDEVGRQELLRSGYCERRVCVIPNGVPVAHSSSASCSAETRRAARLSLSEVNRDLAALNDAPVAVFIGRLTRSQGVFDLARAWQRVVSARSDARLWLIGDGPERGPLFQLVKDLDLQGRVLLPGEFDDYEDVLAAADFYVHPTHEQGVPMGMLRAMAAGLPVIASDVAGSGDLLVHGRHGWLTAPRDIGALSSAVLRMLNEPGRRAMGEAARQRVRDCRSIERCAESHLSIMERMLVAPASREASR